jgi:hypothetical protein
MRIVSPSIISRLPVIPALLGGRYHPNLVRRREILEAPAKAGWPSRLRRNREAIDATSARIAISARKRSPSGSTNETANEAARLLGPVVLSDTWYVGSGRDFVPDTTIALPAGSFVHRVAKTPHYDGVKKGVAQPAIIAILGIGPIHDHLTRPAKPAGASWRR